MTPQDSWRVWGSRLNEGLFCPIDVQLYRECWQSPWSLLPARDTQQQHAAELASNTHTHAHTQHPAVRHWRIYWAFTHPCQLRDPNTSGEDCRPPFSSLDDTRHGCLLIWMHDPLGAMDSQCPYCWLLFVDSPMRPAHTPLQVRSASPTIKASSPYPIDFFGPSSRRAATSPSTLAAS